MTIKPFLCTDIYRRFRGVMNQVEELINECDANGTSETTISKELLIDIGYLLFDGEIATYKSRYFQKMQGKLDLIMNKLGINDDKGGD